MSKASLTQQESPSDQVVLVTDRFTSESIEYLKQKWPCQIIRTNHLPTEAELASAKALLIRSRTEVNKKLLARAPQLKVIITATSGFDHIDLEHCKEKNISVMYTPEGNATSAAELTIMLMLNALRRQTEIQRGLRDGRWKDDASPGHELKDKSVGIIGLGRVGSRVAALLQSFGAHVFAHDPYQDDEVFKRLRVDRLGLSEVFAQAEILTLHVPLTKETRHIINADTLELAHEGVIIINTSRGRVIDEGALVQALESGTVAQAALDVFENEPLARESRLRKSPNAYITPHIGAYTEEAFARVSMMAAEKLIRFFKLGESSDTL